MELKSRNFMEMLKNQWSQRKFVSVGLDSDFAKIPQVIRTKSIKNSIVAFNKAIIDGTKDLACVYKINIAFYLAYGHLGLIALRETIAYANKVAPDVPVILDAKVGDIGNSNNGYVLEAFEYLKADAITVYPYLGSEALKPFLDQKNKGVIVLCRTSNPGAGEFQDWDISGDVVPGGYMPLYKYIAYRVSREWNKYGNCAVVVGATYPEELREVREIVGNMPILIPGIGAQGGDLEKTVAAGKDSQGVGMVINSSRGIIFASNGPNFAEAARLETKILHNLINKYR